MADGVQTNGNSGLSQRFACINPYCAQRTTKFYRTSSDRRQFFCADLPKSSGPPDEARVPNGGDADSLLICVECDKLYDDTLARLFAAFTSGGDVELSSLPIFASAYRQQAFTIDDDENMDSDGVEESGGPVILKRPEDGNLFFPANI
jgi:hypothetical protein